MLDEQVDLEDLEPGRHDGLSLWDPDGWKTGFVRIHADGGAQFFYAHGGLRRTAYLTTKETHAVRPEVKLRRALE